MQNRESPDFRSPEIGISVNHKLDCPGLYWIQIRDPTCKQPNGKWPQPDGILSHVLFLRQ